MNNDDFKKKGFHSKSEMKRIECMQKNRIEEIKQRLEKAAEGEWLYIWSPMGSLSSFLRLQIRNRGYVPVYDDDADFITHSKSDIEWLIEQLEVAVDYFETIKNCKHDQDDEHRMRYLAEQALQKITRSYRRV